MLESILLLYEITMSLLTIVIIRLIEEICNNIVFSDTFRREANPLNLKIVNPNIVII